MSVTVSMERSRRNHLKSIETDEIKVDERFTQTTNRGKWLKVKRSRKKGDQILIRLLLVDTRRIRKKVEIGWRGKGVDARLFERSGGRRG